MKNLNEDLKTGNIKQAYLLYGEEAYLKKQYRDRLTKAVLPEGDTVNYAHYEGKGINVPEIIDLAETMPFFAEKRLIVVEDSGLFKNSDAKFADYIKSMPETVCFVFVESEVDKRSKMYKAVKDTGRVVELGRQDEKTLLLWLAGNMKREGRRIKQSTAEYMLSRTGTDMENLVAYKERPNGSQSKLSTIRDGISIIKKLLHMFCFYKPGKLWKIVVLVAGFIEIKNARVKKFSNIRENLLHILSGMQVLTALVLIENIHYKNKMDSEARLQNKKNIF